MRRGIVDHMVGGGASRPAAEASVSRAARSLERKGLIRQERSARTGEVIYWPAAAGRLPEWEEMARGEEDLADHCSNMSARWSALASRAQSRARRIRERRSIEPTEDERREDLAAVARLSG